jgi:hypothetical protein
MCFRVRGVDVSGPMKRAPRAALAAPLLLALAGAAACSGTAVFDSPNPDGCDTGHGCPVVTCACGDESILIDSTCELGKCVSAEAICTDRCAERGGTASFLASESDILPLPTCPLLCDRMYVNGCKIGCELFASECRPSGAICGAAASDFWECVAGRGQLSCEDGALAVKGCGELPIEYCGLTEQN